MARPREFDEHAAIEGATRAFWAHGYGGTTLPDLLAAMGLTRGSFYKAFGSKHKVYLAALRRYEELVLDPAVALVSVKTGLAGLDRIAAMMRGAVKAWDSTEWRLGCFLCKAAVDLAPHDAAVEAQVQRMVGRLRRAFATALTDAGVTAAAAKSGAHRLTAAYMGLQVLRNAGLPRSAVSAAVEESLREFLPGRGGA